MNGRGIEYTYSRIGIRDSRFRILSVPSANSVAILDFSPMNGANMPRLSLWPLLLLPLLLLPPWIVNGADELDELDVWARLPAAARRTLRDTLRDECLAALTRRRDAYERVQTDEELRRWQSERREFFWRQLGGRIEPTPLDARVVGELRGDGYRVEKVIYASRPGHHVTASLYLPTTPPPYPAVIVPCGHSYNGKAAEAYQRVSLLLARNGIAALCYDPIGQGERYQTFAPDGTPLSAEYTANPSSLRQLAPLPGGPKFNPVEEHTLAGVGAILLGRGAASYRIHDGLRSIDYLVSRPDIDATRIGCTGNSGGGTLTAYLMALDERIACAAPACYLTTFERLLSGNGPQDAEQNIAGQIAFGLDEADYVLLRAPRPTCLLAGTRDATFDILGTWEIFREGKRGYARLGHPERLDLVEADAPHGFTPQLRVGAVRWMRRWLLGKDDAIEEPELPVWSDAELQCTPRGQVMLDKGERSVFDLQRDELRELIATRKERWESLSDTARRAQVRALAGIRPLAELPRLRRVGLGVIQRDGYRIERLVLEAPERPPLPALWFVPEQVTKTWLHLHDQGKQHEAGPGGRIERMVHEGWAVLAVDLSGFGETSEPAVAALAGVRRGHWSHALFGGDGEQFWLGYLLGKSLVGQRAEEILMAARELGESLAPEAARGRVQVMATGDAGVAALHAAALEPQLFNRIQLDGEVIRSWEAVVEAPLAHDHLTETVHGALREYDLPDLETLLDGRVSRTGRR